MSTRRDTAGAAGRPRGAAGGPGSRRYRYCFIAISDASIWSEVEMILLLASKPRWATTRSLNAWARSTLEPSRTPLEIVPRPPVFGAPICACPELDVDWYSDPPALMRPLGLVKLASAIWPSTSLEPLENTPDTTPPLLTVIDWRVPVALPSWLTALIDATPPKLTSAWPGDAKLMAMFCEP